MKIISRYSLFVGLTLLFFCQGLYSSEEQKVQQKTSSEELFERLREEGLNDKNWNENKGTSFLGRLYHSISSTYSWTQASLRSAIWSFAVNRAMQDQKTRTEKMREAQEFVIKDPLPGPVPRELPLSELKDWAKFNEDETDYKVAKDLSGNAQGIDSLELIMRVPAPLDTLKYRIKRRFVRFLQNNLGLNTYTKGPISEDLDEFLAFLHSKVEGTNIAPPIVAKELKEEYEKKDRGDYLGPLLTRGPFAELVEYDAKNHTFSLKSNFNYPNHNKDFHHLDCKLEGHYNPALKSLAVDKITLYLPDPDNYGTTPSDPEMAVVFKKGDKGFLEAQRIMGSAISTLVTVFYHLGRTHLQIAQVFTDAIRNHLPENHPIRAFLEPFTMFTSEINNSVHLLLENLLSAISAGRAPSANITKLIIHNLAKDLKVEDSDPIFRGLKKGTLERDGDSYNPVSIPDEKGVGHPMYYPTQTQTIEIFEHFLTASEKAMDLLSPEQMEELKPFQEYLIRNLNGTKELIEELSPKGGDMSQENFKKPLARLMAIFINNGTVEHEKVGNLTWNVSSLHPLIPPVFNKKNAGGVNNKEKTEAFINTSMSTMAELPTLYDVLQNSGKTFKKVEKPDQKEGLQKIYTDLYESLEDYSKKYKIDEIEKKAKDNRDDMSLDETTIIKPKDLEAGVQI